MEGTPRPAESAAICKRKKSCVRRGRDDRSAKKRRRRRRKYLHCSDKEGSVGISGRKVDAHREREREREETK